MTNLGKGQYLENKWLCQIIESRLVDVNKLRIVRYKYGLGDFIFWLYITNISNEPTPLLINRHGINTVMLTLA